MKIGFDVSQTGAGKAGCGYYADGLIRALEGLQSGHNVLLYPAFGDLFWDPLCATAAYSTSNPLFERIEAPASFADSQSFWANPGPDFEARIGSPDLVHSNNFFCPRGLRRGRLVYTLHDLSFLVDPSWTTEANRVGCFDGVFGAATRADWIVANSGYSRRHFLEVFPHYPAERTTVIYAGSRYSLDAPAPPRPGRLGALAPEGFWLSVGSLEPRKNQRRLVEAYARSGSRLPLAVAGGKGWLMDDFAKEASPAGVVLAGYASNLRPDCFHRFVGNCRPEVEEVLPLAIFRSPRPKRVPQKIDLFVRIRHGPPVGSPLFQGLSTLRSARKDLSSRLESATGRSGAYPDRASTC